MNNDAIQYLLMLYSDIYLSLPYRDMLAPPGSWDDVYIKKRLLTQKLQRLRMYENRKNKK